MNNYQDTSLDRVWQQVCHRVRGRITEQAFATWFDPIVPISKPNGKILLEVPSQFYGEWIESHYGDLIASTFKEISGKAVSLEYRVAADTTIVKEADPNGKDQKPPGVAYDRGTQLNKRYTFDRFVSGPSNQFAKAAAESVAHAPGQTAFNPLVVYGGVGLGKTHLLQAIGNFILDRGAAHRVHYTTSEKFTLEFIQSIQNNRTTEFSERYRNIDSLLMDDIQFLQKKEQTQERFFHTFNELFQQGKQIVLTTDRHPSELYGLQDRLISRFQSGLIVDIQIPSLETRIAILQKKAAEDNLKIPYDVLEFIAAKVRNNIREMEGALIKLLALSSLSCSEITMEVARRALRETLGRNSAAAPTIDDVIKGVCAAMNIQESRMIGKGRKTELAQARQVAMFLSRELIGASLENIGLHFGGRDHTTVLHACRAVKKKIKADPQFSARLERMRNHLTN